MISFDRLLVRSMVISDRIKRMCRDRRGATAIEYGLIAAGIAIAIITAVSLMGSNLNVMFNKVATSINK